MLLKEIIINYLFFGKMEPKKEEAHFKKSLEVSKKTHTLTLKIGKKLILVNFSIIKILQKKRKLKIKLQS